ncbi:hypothetical protein BTW08_14435 [Salinicola sp. MH3R3-1]|nr:hypothetical protein BTW08_14435 [Salinicola sp. MH3R3-1]
MILRIDSLQRSQCPTPRQTLFHELATGSTNRRILTAIDGDETKLNRLEVDVISQIGILRGMLWECKTLSTISSKIPAGLKLPGAIGPAEWFPPIGKIPYV